MGFYRLILCSSRTLYTEGSMILRLAPPVLPPNLVLRLRLRRTPSEPLRGPASGPAQDAKGAFSPMFRYLSWIVPACLVFTCGCSKEQKEAEEEAPAPVQVTAVTQDAIQRVTRGDGALFPQNQWNVMP